MGDAQLDAVLAGSKGFALALFVPLTEQVGVRPRVATDATQALTLVESPRGLVVVEVEGEGTVRSIRELLATRKDFTVVAAVPLALAGTHDALRALGVELVSWDGSPSAVLGAVSRRLGTDAARSAPVPAAPVAPAAVGAGVTPAPRVPAPDDPFFTDLEPVPDEGDVLSLEDLGLDPEPAPAPPPAVAGGVAALAATPAQPRGNAWPAGGLTASDAESTLVRGISGKFSADPRLRAATEGVVSTLSALEVGVLVGDAVTVSPEPIRRAAIMRLQVAHALAEKPPPGSNVDQGALSAMLGEIDALLSEVAALAQGAPAEVLPSLEAVRNALVREAIDFSETAQQLAPAGLNVAASAPAVSAAARRAPAARVLTVTNAPDRIDTRTRNLVIALAVMGLAAGGYHGWRYLERTKAIVPPSTVAGAPIRAMGGTSAAGSKFITSKDGKPFTDAELETFRQREELQGRRIQVVSPTTVISVPSGSSSAPVNPAAQPAPPPQPQQPPQGATP